MRICTTQREKATKLSAIVVVVTPLVLPSDMVPPESDAEVPKAPVNTRALVDIDGVVGKPSVTIPDGDKLKAVPVKANEPPMKFELVEAFRENVGLVMAVRVVAKVRLGIVIVADVPAAIVNVDARNDMLANCVVDVALPMTMAVVAEPPNARVPVVSIVTEVSALKLALVF